MYWLSRGVWLVCAWVLGIYLLICIRLVSFTMLKVLMVLYLGCILRLARVEHGRQEVRNLQPVFFEPHSHPRYPLIRSRIRGTAYTSETNLVMQSGLCDPCIRPEADATLPAALGLLRLLIS